jgi:hypothetical protein
VDVLGLAAETCVGSAGPCCWHPQLLLLLLLLHLQPMLLEVGRPSSSCCAALHVLASKCLLHLLLLPVPGELGCSCGPYASRHLAADCCCCWWQRGRRAAALRKSPHFVLNLAEESKSHDSVQQNIQSRVVGLAGIATAVCGCVEVQANRVGHCQKHPLTLATLHRILTASEKSTLACRRAGKQQQRLPGE